MLPMHEKEFAKWTEVRQSGSTKYALKTSLSSTIIVFLLYFVTNGYLNLAHIDKYIAGVIAESTQLIVALIVTCVVLFIIAKILFRINEKRYSNTQNKGNNAAG